MRDILHRERWPKQVITAQKSAFICRANHCRTFEPVTEYKFVDFTIATSSASNAATARVSSYHNSSRARRGMTGTNTLMYHEIYEIVFLRHFTLSNPPSRDVTEDLASWLLQRSLPHKARLVEQRGDGSQAARGHAGETREKWWAEGPSRT